MERNHPMIPRGHKGLTLMESIVSMAIFVTVVTIATTIFLIANNSQQRTRTGSELQNTAQQIIETLSRDIRSQTIDYEYYLTQDGDALKTVQEVLVLRDLSGKQLRYNYNVVNGSIESCSCSGFSCNAVNACANLWQPLTSDNITVTRLNFYIAPASNPFLKPTKPADCRGGQFDETVGLCLKASGCWAEMQTQPSLAWCYNPNQQPKVTVVLEMNNGETDPNKSIDVSLQTSITSRMYGR